MSYLRFCGYSFFTTTLKGKLSLAAVFFGLVVTIGGVVKLILGSNA